MPKHQEHAAFFFETLAGWLANSAEKDPKRPLGSLSSFDIDYIYVCNPRTVSEGYASAAMVFYNLVQRGLPTRMPFSLEKVFNEVFDIFEEYEYLGGLYHRPNNNLESKREHLIRALHVVDPRITLQDLKNDYEYSWEQLDSTYEEDFYFQILGSMSGPSPWLAQFIETQRELSEIINQHSRNERLERNFTEQRCDFTLEFPALIDGKKGIIIEVDGPHHHADPQKRLDQARDEAAKNAHWVDTIRIPVEEWGNKERYLRPLQQIIRTPYFQTVARNYQDPLYASEDGLRALQIMLAPIQIARIQKTLLNLILKGHLNPEEPIWKICVIERDIPGSSLALHDLWRQIHHYSELIESPINLPELEISVYTTKDFKDAELHVVSPEIPVEISEILKDDTQYDIVIDSSVLARTRTWELVEFSNKPTNYIVLTSTRSITSNRKFQTGEPVRFRQLSVRDAQGNYTENEKLKTHLEVFLLDIFRKKALRRGQLPILNRALRQESVIGLLPTGGGKSLTYQLSTLLQPGIALIIDPIKSLMRDQVNSLTKNHIDCGDFVNSSLKREEKEIAHQRLIDGDILFFFMSPERLLIPDFRGVLESMHEKKNYFTYCIIDEAHCVSEWGHDFRTSYLFLGKNATRFAKTFTGEPISLFGLTATASYDVLADIQRELSGDIDNIDNILSDEAVVRFESFNRPEMQYEVRRVSISTDSLPPDEWKIKGELGNRKHSEILSILEGIPQRLQELNEDPESVYIPITDNHISEEEREQLYQQIHIDEFNPEQFWRSTNENAGIVFCPHRSWYFGVTDKYKPKAKFHNGVADSITGNLPHSSISVGTFMGVDQDASTESNQEADNQRFQDEFINNELNLMVCTKAFGMGIDKPNVRLAVHLNYPQSLESYVQEAGRIGRDGKMALSCIVYNDQDFVVQSTPQDRSLVNYDRQILNDFYGKSFPGEQKEKWNLAELLRGIELPPHGNVDDLAGFMLEERGLELHLNVQTNQQGTNPYLRVKSAEYQSVGILFLETLDPSIRYSDVPETEARQILDSVKSAIMHLKPEDENSHTWLSQAGRAERGVGIEQLLEDMEEGEERALVLFFTNNTRQYDDRVRQILDGRFGGRADKLLDQYKYTSSIDDYLNKLTNLSDEEADGIRQCFYRTRTKHDTEKSLYRLALVGVVSDFDTDYLHRTFTVTIVKRSDQDYQRILRSYIRRYYSEAKTKRIVAGIQDRPGENFIQKSLNFIIGFLYTEIAQKRWKAIDAVEEACKVGATQGNGPMKEYIDVYFNSKYGRTGYSYEVEGEEKNGSLLDRTDEGRESSIEIVWEFIHIATEWDTSGAELVNLKHLRGACIRFLTSNPKNGALLLLKAFCTLILEEERIQESVLIREATVDIAQGFEFLRDDEDVMMTSIVEMIEDYFELLNVTASREGLIRMLDDIREYQLAQTNRRWLETFNNKFLVNYE
jgi:superfamily II DNA helicase RecQ